MLFVITTDGMENASREYGYERIKAMVEQQRERRGWEFIFLGANIDAIEAAGRFGIAANRVQNYYTDSEGTRLNYEVTARALASFRENGSVADDWGDEIKADFLRRGGRRNGKRT